MTIEVVNLHKGHCDDFFTRVGDVYIGSASWYKGKRIPKSQWNNPFAPYRGYAREQAISFYRGYLKSSIEKGYLNLADLEDVERLGCWCNPAPCHGDILKEFLEAQLL